MAISENKLDAWARKHDLKKLHKALKEYDYKTRIVAASHLGKIKNRESLPFLDALIDDSFLQVLEAAEKAIASIAPTHPSLPRFRQCIAHKEQIEAKRGARTAKNFTPLTEEEEQKKLEEAAKRVSIARIYQQEIREREKRNKNWAWAQSILDFFGV